MKKLYWIFLLGFLYLAACQNQNTHNHDDATHEQADHDHDDEHAHGDGTHTHADGTTHADHPEQEEFKVDSLKKDSLRQQ